MGQNPEENSPYGNQPGNNAPDSSYNSPYANGGASQPPPTPNFGTPQNNMPPAPAPAAGGFNIFGLTWAKNVVPAATRPVAPKSFGVAAVLWFFLGWIGVHQFYLGNTNRGLFNLVLAIGTSILSVTGIPFGIIYLAYWIYEIITLQDQTNEINSGYVRKSIL